ncbi:Phosphoglycerate/bisphosphoglycerate mutase [Beggiatoa sp. PS]|nr:Phosphoglycerate/bisphosphoglycerate mutase [Beggiatoa sp. PS]
MDIYLIRHSRVKVSSDTCYGQTDVLLADSFLEEVQNIKKQLPDFTQAVLMITSPLQRCLQLAQQLSFHQDNHIVIDKRLMEINFGEWEMQRWNEIDSALLQEWMNDYVHLAPPQGESYETLLIRCQEFWQALLKKNVSTVLVITHAGVIRALIAHLLEMPLKNAFAIQVDYGSVSKIKYHQDAITNWITIEYLNKVRNGG